MRKKKEAKTKQQVKSKKQNNNNKAIVTLAGDAIIGTIDALKSGDAYLIAEDTERDIYIHRKNINRAFHGDIVKVQRIYHSRSRKLEGSVIEVVERKKTKFIGTVDKSSNFCFVIPDSIKMSVDFYIPEAKMLNAKHGDKVVVQFIEWRTKDKNPIGAIIEVLGKSGMNETEMKSILIDYGFSPTFPIAVQEAAEAISTSIPKSELKKRKDFRSISTFTIDPVDAKDFDDAISFEKVSETVFQVGVHIADVSHYVQPNTILDNEALQRATSVYLVDRVAPMFPEHLSNIVCSLRPNEDKLCFAAVFLIDSSTKILDVWYGKTVIHSCQRFTYEEAQEIIEGKEHTLSFAVNTINTLAKQLRKQRIKNGSINFEAPETKFKLDNKGKPVGVYVKERKEAHLLIEEFMLLANKYVAHFIGVEKNKSGKTPMVYRVHDLPNQEKLQDFALFADRFGYKIQFDNPKQTARSLNKLMENIQGKPEQSLLESLAIRSMSKAIYTTKNIGHYGLGFDYYTHFTSPIRRYPDVIVHRLLFAILEGKQLANEKTLEQQCKHSSEREKAAAEAERTSVKYKMAEYMLDRVGEQFTGVISGVKNWGFYVELPEYNCEGLVRIEYLNDDNYLFDEKNIRIVGKRHGKTYQLGDVVEVILSAVDIEKKTIDFQLP